MGDHRTREQEGLGPPPCGYWLWISDQSRKRRLCLEGLGLEPEEGGVWEGGPRDTGFQRHRSARDDGSVMGIERGDITGGGAGLGRDETVIGDLEPREAS